VARDGSAPRSRGRRPSLTLTFALLSLVLTAALGVVLSAQLTSTITRRSISALRQTTTGGINLTLGVILATKLQTAPGLPLTLAQEVAQAKLMTTASRILIGDGQSVGVEVALPNGAVVAGWGAAPVGTTLARDAEFRTALGGGTQTESLLRSRATGVSTVERRLLRQHGDLLMVQVGVRLAPGDPVQVVVRTYAAMGPTQRQAAADLRTLLSILALGLVVFWAVLFRLVLGTSRALRRQLEENTYLATHDTLTGLPNRLVLRDRVEQAIIAGVRSGRLVAVLRFGINRFKEVNDAIGYDNGDRVLQLVGPRLREALREADTVARVGGDEFVVMLAGLTSPLQAVTVAEKLTTAMHQPFELHGMLVDISGCFGIAVTHDQEHGDDFAELMQHADVAMMEAKHEHLEVVVYSPELDSHSMAHLALFGDLRRSIDDEDQIVVHYQPKVDLSSGQVVSVEALVRWQHPRLGLLEPDEFIPLAERTGLIRPLTWCVLRKALVQNRVWAREGVFLRVAVNVSARCLLDSTFPEHVGRLLQETDVPPERLDLEITETAMLAHPDQTLVILHRLSTNGIRLSIDDFGTGYSSLSQLKRLPVKELKIDKAFVTAMVEDDNDAAIVRSSIELARKMHLDVVAEGVETEEVLDQLVELGCTSAQGFYISKPLPAARLGAWLVAWQLRDVRCHRPPEGHRAGEPAVPRASGDR